MEKYNKTFALLFTFKNLCEDKGLGTHYFAGYLMSAFSFVANSEDSKTTIENQIKLIQNEINKLQSYENKTY